MLLPLSDLVLSKMARRVQSGDEVRQASTAIWIRKDAQLHWLAKNMCAMLLNDTSERFDFRVCNEYRWEFELTQSMACAVVLELCCNEFVSHMVTGGDDRILFMINDLGKQNFRNLQVERLSNGPTSRT